jgi:hypothetical protein
MYVYIFQKNHAENIHICIYIYVLKKYAATPAAAAAAAALFCTTSTI